MNNDNLKHQVEAAVMALGGKKWGNEINFCCANATAHKNNDANNSAYYNTAKGCWHCFVCRESGNYWHMGVLLGVINNCHRAVRRSRRWWRINRLCFSLGLEYSTTDRR
jgi:hypothetical protein